MKKNKKLLILLKNVVLKNLPNTTRNSKSSAKKTIAVKKKKRIFFFCTRSDLQLVAISQKRRGERNQYSLKMALPPQNPREWVFRDSHSLTTSTRSFRSDFFFNDEILMINLSFAFSAVRRHKVINRHGEKFVGTLH